MQNETQKPKIILIVGSGSEHLAREAMMRANTFKDFPFEIFEEDVEEKVQELTEKMKGTIVLPEIPIHLLCEKPIVVEKNLPTYRQDRSKHYFKRFLK